ncbi:SCO family protein [Vulgatibacter sp.]|uniref:SCO family protein n=1 Tax=Vulgatibacter sp. TaxID=1971226 RepID=UPI003562CCBF
MIHLLLVALLLLPAAARATDAIRSEPAAEVRIPDVVLLDQDGTAVDLQALLRDRTVAINFVFSTCTTICSPMTAVFARLQRELGTRGRSDVALVSISLDPATDTPARLKRWADSFGRREGWTFLTGDRDKVAAALRGLGGHVPDRNRHAPWVLIGDTGTGTWRKVLGLASPERLVQEIEGLRAGQAVASAEEAARRWFTDRPVVDQHGKRHRFYSDLVRGRIVLVNFGFTECQGACPPIAANLARVQKLLGDRVGGEVRILTVSVDPERDSPAALTTYAQRFGAKAGWFFLTGERENVDAIRQRLGDVTKDRDAHPTTLFIGDTRTGNWIRAMATAPAEQIAEAVLHLNDE